LLVKGTITKINEELGYGFIVLNSDKNKVFFSEDTSVLGTNLTDLVVGQKVLISVDDTERGLFASALQLESTQLKSPVLDQNTVSATV